MSETFILTYFHTYFHTNTNIRFLEISCNEPDIYFLKSNVLLTYQMSRVLRDFVNMLALIDINHRWIWACLGVLGRHRICIPLFIWRFLSLWCFSLRRCTTSWNVKQRGPHQPARSSESTLVTQRVIGASARLLSHLSWCRWHPHFHQSLNLQRRGMQDLYYFSPVNSSWILVITTSFSKGSQIVYIIILE